MTYEFQIEKTNGRVVRVEESKGQGFQDFAEFYLPSIHSDEQIRLRIRDEHNQVIGIVFFKR